MRNSRARTMANTYTQIYVQVIFAVRGRQNLLRRENREELHKYVTGIVRNSKQKLIRINSVQDHVRILLGVNPYIALSDLVRDIKANSSRFINEKRCVKGRFNGWDIPSAFWTNRKALVHSHIPIRILTE